MRWKMMEDFFTYPILVAVPSNIRVRIMQKDKKEFTYSLPLADLDERREKTQMFSTGTHLQ